jgi:chromate reductase
MPTSDQLTFATLCGSLRKDSYNQALVRALPAIGAGDVTFVDVGAISDVPHYDGDLEKASGMPTPINAMLRTISKADGVVIVSPEYNYSMPGVLKNTLDWLSRAPNQPFDGKPVLIQSVSGGVVGGFRMQHHLRQTLVFLNARVMARPELALGKAGQVFNADGDLIDPAARELVRLQLAAFSTFVRSHQAG